MGSFSFETRPPLSQIRMVARQGHPMAADGQMCPSPSDYLQGVELSVDAQMPV